MLVNIFINSYDGKIPAMYHKSENIDAPGVIIAVPRDDSMSEKDFTIIKEISDIFIESDFSVLVVNYRIKGEDNNPNTLIKDSIRAIYDISVALDWLRSKMKEESSFYMVGVSYSCTHVTNITMRRPEIEYLMLFNPFPVKNIDYSFLSPAPCNSAIFNDKDNTRIASEIDCIKLANSLNEQILYNTTFKTYDSKKKDYIEELKDQWRQLINEERAIKIDKPIKKKRRRRSKKSSI